jgi:hypothetical protein
MLRRLGRRKPKCKSKQSTVILQRGGGGAGADGGRCCTLCSRLLLRLLRLPLLLL